MKLKPKVQPTLATCKCVFINITNIKNYLFLNQILKDSV